MRLLILLSYLVYSGVAGAVDKSTPENPSPVVPPPPQTEAIRAFQMESTDTPAALDLYERGCGKKEATACAGQGALLQRQGKIEAAKIAYVKGCELGDGYACYQLAVWAAANEKTRFWRLACEGGIGRACFLWGNKQRGTGGDAEVAFKKGCQRLDWDSCNGLGLIAREKKDWAKARDLFENVCAKRPELGCNNLGLVEWELGNASRAQSLLEVACTQRKDFEACNSFGVIAKKRGDLKTAARMYKLACEAGIATACRNLDRMASR